MPNPPTAAHQANLYETSQRRQYGAEVSATTGGAALQPTTAGVTSRLCAIEIYNAGSEIVYLRRDGVTAGGSVIPAKGQGSYDGVIATDDEYTLVADSGTQTCYVAYWEYTEGVTQ